MFQIDLVERCRKNDRKAQLKLYEQYCDGMYCVAMRFLKNADDAEDVLQEAFIKAYRAIDRFRGDSAFYTWMYRIAKNYWIDRCRERAAAPNMGSLDAPIREDEGRSMTLTDTVEGDTPRPAEELRRQEIGQAIYSMGVVCYLISLIWAILAVIVFTPTEESA